MEFKAGDKVRVTREGLERQAENSFVKSYEISWWTIKKIAGDAIYCPNNEYRYEGKYLELVPEEPDFEYGEAIEVKIDEWFPWVERPFIYFAKWNAIHPYITANINKAQFDAWKKFDFQAFRYARKLKPQLTRKEIAEKFWVNEDFILID